MRTHATSRIGEMGLKIFNGFLIFFNGYPIFLNGFPKSSTAFCFPRNWRKSIYGKKYTKDHYLSFVFFATCSPTRAPSFVIPATVAIGYSWLDGLLRSPWSGVQNPSGARVQWIEGCYTLGQGFKPLGCWSVPPWLGVRAPHVQSGYILA